MTKNETKFMPWLSFWSSDKKIVSRGINSVPPPIPSPPNIPDIRPNKKYKNMSQKFIL